MSYIKNFWIQSPRLNNNKLLKECAVYTLVLVCIFDKQLINTVGAAYNMVRLIARKKSP